jgi:hypothetical protein
VRDGSTSKLEEYHRRGDRPGSQIRDDRTDVVDRLLTIHSGRTSRPWPSKGPLFPQNPRRYDCRSSELLWLKTRRRYLGAAFPRSMRRAAATNRKRVAYLENKWEGLRPLPMKRSRKSSKIIWKIGFRL